MRAKINYWSDVPERRVESIDWRPGKSAAWLWFEDGVLQVESERPGMPICFQGGESGNEVVDLMTLTELRVEKIIVPYVNQGYAENAAVVFVFEDNQVICIASEDNTVPVRIS